MGVPASMQSMLVRQFLALKEPVWLQKHTADWLVWEPGAWKVPQLQGGVASTQIALAQPDRPQKGDCLCFELKPVVGVKLKVGRAPENDIVLNDATVSREHLLIERLKDQWVAHALASSKATLVKGKAASPGTAVPLASGDTLTVGGVVLSYLTASALVLRLKNEAARLTRS